MRIVQIVPTLKRGGAERLCVDICQHLTLKGAIVKLVTFHKQNEFNYDLSTFETSQLSASVHLSVSKPNSFCTQSLQQFIAAFKPDIIHSHLFESEIVSRSLSYPRAKWFTHCHDNMRQFETLHCNTLFSKKKLTEFYERFYLLNRYRKNGGNHFIAVSKDTEAYFNRVLPKDLRKVTLLHNGVNISNFTRPQNHNRRRTALLELVTTGSLVDNKNQSFLIDVANELKLRGVDVRLHILGGGVNKERLQTKIEQLNLNNQVSMHGVVNNVAEFLWNADVYVHASLSESFGLVFVEAMAAGLPVVSLDARGNRDIIQNDINGYILAEQSVKEFADKAELLFTNKQKYADMSRHALETAKQFDIVNYTDKLLNLYQAALEGK
ncbi:MAG: glycosyltransferase [Chitinophagales bacterium]|nr:glycosyltransferase [Chitinophagales bacterium]